MRTIKTVFDQMNSWKGEKGEFKFIDGEFEDGLRFSYMAKPDNAAKVQQELRDLIGKPGDFAGEEKTDNQGRVKFRLKDYPGKVKAGGFGGGGAKAPYPVSWTNTREGQQFTTASIQAQVALKCAVEAVARQTGAPPSADLATILEYAAAFANFLATTVPTPQEAPKPAETPGEAPGPGMTPEAASKIAFAAKDEGLLKTAWDQLPEALRNNNEVRAAFRKAKYHIREVVLEKLIDELDFLGQIHAFAKRMKIDLDAMRIKADPDACGELIAALKIEQDQRAFA